MVSRFYIFLDYNEFIARERVVPCLPTSDLLIPFGFKAILLSEALASPHSLSFRTLFITAFLFYQIVSLNRRT